MSALKKNMSSKPPAGMEFFDNLSVPRDEPPHVRPDDLEGSTSAPPHSSSSLFRPADDDPHPPLAPAGAYGPPNPAQPNIKNAQSIIATRPVYRAHVQSTRNNTIVTVSRPNGQTFDVMRVISGGTCRFKKSNRAGFEAGYQCATGMFQLLEEEQNKGIDLQWELFLKGYGQGREAVQRALMSSEGMIMRGSLIRVTDRTPIKIGGTRAKKARRL